MLCVAHILSTKCSKFLPMHYQQQKSTFDYAQNENEFSLCAICLVQLLMFVIWFLSHFQSIQLAFSIRKS